MDEKYLGVADVARLLDVVPARIRQLVEQGKLKAMRTVSGVRFFRINDVERLRRERLRKQKKQGLANRQVPTKYLQPAAHERAETHPKSSSPKKLPMDGKLRAKHRS